MKLPLVTIMIPVYDGMPMLQASIRSVISQSYDNWECIICDDGSRDGTELYLKTFETDPRFILLSNDRKMGRGISRQRILDSSHGKYVCMLDSGDLMHPYRIEAQVAYLESHPDVALVSSGMLSFGTHTQLLRVRGLGDGIPKQWTTNSSPCFASSMFRSELARKAGAGFGTQSMCEDTCFLTRFFDHYPTYAQMDIVLYYYSEFDARRIDHIASYLQLFVFYFRNKKLTKSVINILKAAYAVVVFPFTSMEKRISKRGRPATEVEVAEFKELRKEIQLK